MAYPTVALDGSFEDETAYEVRKIFNTLTEGGTSDKARDGINSTKESRNITQTFFGFNTKQNLENFFKSRLGKPFVYSPFLDVTATGNLYKCLEFNFENLGGDCYKLSANFIQIYRLKP